MIDVLPSGTVTLGPDVVCDGFEWSIPLRVQTHVHDDHMTAFDKSKGFQEIILSRGTKALLVSERNADLGYRQNLHELPPNRPYLTPRGWTVTLLPNEHMLGSVQVKVEHAECGSLGYSGDFAWPLDDVMQVDALVVDSTYGSPDRRRQFTQEQVNARFCELMHDLIRRGPVHLTAYRGTIQRALQLLPALLDCPVIASPRQASEMRVYATLGYSLPEVLVAGTAEARAAKATGRFVAVYAKGDRRPRDFGDGCHVSLSAFAPDPSDPVLEYTPSSFRVAMTNHADFDETLEYVAATGAKYVVCDNTRGGQAIRLATELRERMGLRARPSTTGARPVWLPDVD